MSNKSDAIPPTPTVSDYEAEADRPLIPDVSDPFALFEAWLAEAREHELNDPSAMSLATVDAQGDPDVRVVLLRGISADEGLKFYTNYNSVKGQQLEARPQAAICIHWKSLRRQVRARGNIVRLSEADSDEYFNRRTPQSRISAIASDQSQPLESREAFMRRVEAVQEKYPNEDDIKRPANWGGYGLMPTEIEFWQDQAFRMHDRLRLRLVDGVWQGTRLYP